MSQPLDPQQNYDQPPLRKQIDVPAAVERLDQLCQSTNVELGSLAETVRDLSDAGEAEAAFNVLDRHFAQPEAPSVVGVAWVAASKAANLLDMVASRLAKMDWQTDAWHAAAQAYLEELGQRGDGNEGLRNVLVLKFVRQHRDLIWRNSQTWAAAGRALAAVTGPADALHFMADWRHRVELTPAMLRPVVIAAWELGKLDDACEASEQALELDEEQGSHFHRMNHAFSGFVEVHPDGHEYAQHCFKAVDATCLEEADLPWWRLTTSLQRWLGQPRPIDLAAARSEINTAFAEPRSELGRRTTQLALAALSKHNGQRLKAWWHRRAAR